MMICRECHRLTTCALMSFENISEGLCETCKRQGILFDCKGRDIHRSPRPKEVDKSVEPMSIPAPGWLWPR